MIGIGAVLLVALVVAAWRRAAWTAALLGVAVGISASGPIVNGIQAGIAAGTSLARSLDSLV